MYQRGLERTELVIPDNVSEKESLLTRNRVRCVDQMNVVVDFNVRRLVDQSYYNCKNQAFRNCLNNTTNYCPSRNLGTCVRQLRKLLEDMYKMGN